MKKFLAVIAVVGALAGCGSSTGKSNGMGPQNSVDPSSRTATIETPSATPTETASPTPSPTESPTPSPTPVSLADYIAALRTQYNLPPGYPMVVDRTTIEDRFAANLNSDQVVNPWPGVYMDFAPGTDLGTIIAHSSTVGYCASIKSFKAASGNDSGYACF